MTITANWVGAMYASDWVRRGVRPTLLLLYIVLLHWTYASFVAPTFGYLKMGYRSPDPWGYALLAAGVVAIGFLQPRRIDKPSEVVLWIHFVLATAPTALIAQITPFLPRGLAFRFGLAVEVAWAGVLLLMRWVSYRHPDLPGPLVRIRRRVSAGLWLAGLLTITLSATVLTFLLPGVGHQVVSFGHVADVRLQYRQALGQVPSFVPYVLLSAVYVTNPTLIAYGWMRRRWLLIFVGLAGQVLNYSVTGYKTVALSLVLVVGLAWLLERVGQIGGRTFLLAMVGGMAVALGAFLVAGLAAPATYFTTRMLVVPGNVAAAHVALFSKVDPLYWSQAFMSSFVHYPYVKPPSFIVGYFLSGSQDTNANVNLFGDGYESARYAGVAVECLVLALLLLVLDLVSARVPRQVVLPVVLVPAFLLTNANVFTSLLTSGFALTIIVLMFAPRLDAECPASTPMVPSS